MSSGLAAPASLLIGGLLWLLEALAGATGLVGGVLHWVGLAFLLAGSCLWGARLVNTEVWALRAVVAVATPLLVWSFIEFFRPERSGWYDPAWGLVAVAVALPGLVREIRVDRPRPRAQAHAA